MRSIAGVLALLAVTCPAVGGAAASPDEEPAKVDEHYTAAGLRQGFATLCRKLGYRARVVEVDESEFPYLVYGVIEGRCDYRRIRDTLPSVTGYAYQGCVTSVRRDGSATIFALNMIPSRGTEAERSQRLMARLQKLAATQQ